MHCTGKDTAEYYPDVCRRTEKDTHYRTEDRSGAGNVQELDEINLPRIHRHEVNAVTLGVTRHRIARIDANRFLYESSVENRADNQGYYAKNE